VSFTVTPPLDVSVSILSTTGLCLENMYRASGFSLQAGNNIYAVELAFYTAHTLFFCFTTHNLQYQRKKLLLLLPDVIRSTGMCYGRCRFSA